MSGDRQYAKHYTKRSTSIPFDPDKMRWVLYRNHINLVEVGRALGLSKSWMNVTLNKRVINYYRLDEIAVLVNMDVEDLFDEVVDHIAWTRDFPQF